MTKVADSIVILFAVSAISGFLLRFVKDRVWKELTFKPLLSRLSVSTLILLPFVGLFLLGQQFGVPASTGLPWFIGSALLSYFLGAVNLPSYLRGILLLAAAVAGSIYGSADSVLVAGGSALLGLFVCKLTENLSFAKESSFDDLVPPFIWLTGVMWIHSAYSGATMQTMSSALLGIMSVSLLLRLVQGPFVSTDPRDDKVFLKRLMLSATGGLAVLIVLVKMLAAMNLQSLSLLCGAGYFMTYLFKNLDLENKYAVPSATAVKLLILTGILTFVATRFFGTFGLIALAPVAMVVPFSCLAIIPGLYWASRALLQVFIQNYNMNVTGINVTHQYAGAAMYAGFLLAIVIAIFFREFKDRRVLLTIMAAVGIVVPVMSNFLLHAEPTSSLLISVTVAASLMAVMAPSVLKEESKGVENLMLVPGIMIGSGLISSGLLEAGLESTVDVKTAVLSCGIVFVMVMIAAYWWWFQRSVKKPAAASETA